MEETKKKKNKIDISPHFSVRIISEVSLTKILAIIFPALDEEAPPPLAL